MPELLLLFTSAFLAATILPFPSEVTLAGLLQVGRVDAAPLWLVATAGNTLGSLINWVIGRFALRWQHHPRFPVRPSRLVRAQRWFNRMGVWTLLFAWLPVVGDPLTLVAGIMRTPFLLTLILVAIGKGVRYAVVIGLAGG
jgi:membrane protein YqaA with SNARE-associated domain